MRYCNHREKSRQEAPKPLKKPFKVPLATKSTQSELKIILILKFGQPFQRLWGSRGAEPLGKLHHTNRYYLATRIKSHLDTLLFCKMLPYRRRLMATIFHFPYFSVRKNFQNSSLFIQISLSGILNQILFFRQEKFPKFFTIHYSFFTQKFPTGIFPTPSRPFR